MLFYINLFHGMILFPLHLLLLLFERTILHSEFLREKVKNKVEYQSFSFFNRITDSILRTIAKECNQH